MNEHLKQWKAPEKYVLESDNDLERLVKDLKVTSVVDPIEYLADDLYELEHPDKMQDKLGRQAYVASILSLGVAYGKWFYYADEGKLVRFAPPDEHLRMRTSRNRNLIRTNEQYDIYNKRIAVFGLSVGSRAVESAVQLGVGNNYMLFDPDTISVANLNRINAPYSSVGEFKTTHSGRRISDLDPYIEQAHFTDGYTSSTDELLRANRPDIIIEEVDDMVAKARIRNIASELRIPVVMAGDVDDRSVLSVERYDERTIEIFNGLLSREEVTSLLYGTMSHKDQQSALIKIVGARNLSLRLLDSVPQIGREIAGMPQLGTTATIGGAVVADTIRDIFLNRGVPSGRRTLNVRDVIGSGRTTGMREGTRIIRDFLAYRRQGK